MENPYEQLNFMMQNRPRKKLQILRSLTFKFQNIKDIAFKSNETYSITKRLLSLFEELEFVEQQTEISNYRRLRFFKWTEKGFAYFQILEKQYTEKIKETRKLHGAMEKSGILSAKYPSLNTTDLPLVNEGVQK